MKRAIIRIGNVADIGRGSSPRPITDKRYFENGEIPWIKIADATTSGKYIYKTKQYVNDLGASYSRKMKPGTLILSASGSLGIPHFLGVEGCIHDGWIYMDNIHDIDKQYLYYLLLTMRPYFDNLSYGAAIQNINTSILSKTKIEVPSIQSQEKIGLMLSSYDNLIENNNKRIKLLEQMAESLYKEWFVRFRFPGCEDVEFEEKRPRGWQVGTEEKNHLIPFFFKYDELGTVGSFVRGKNITAAKMVKGDIPVISAGISPSGFHNAANVYGASLTISASGANAGYLQYHVNDIWAADCSYYQDDATIWFVYNTLKYLRPVISNLQCGAAQPHVYPKNINTLCVLIPTEELINKYNDFVKPYYDEIQILNQHNQLLTKQRDMLLPRLMSGKLEV